MKRLESHLYLVVSFVLAALLTAGLATGTAQSAVASLVQIVNTAANPVPTQDMYNGARQPVSLETNVVVSPNVENGFANHIYQVPTGKRLVIEYLGASAAVPASEQVLWVSILGDHAISSAFAVANNSSSYNDSPGFHAVVATQPVTLYLDQGDWVDVWVQTNAGASGMDRFAVFITGYLVDVP